MVADGSAEGPAAAAEDFAHLPSAKLLTELIEATTSESLCKWDPNDVELAFPCLGRLWQFTKIAAAAQCREKKEKESPASEFISDVGQLDQEFGDPLERRWLITSYEGARRFDAVTAYLYRSGLLSLRHAEQTAPTEFLQKREMQGL